MTARYEPVARWGIPRSVVDATLRGILRAGRDNHEGGVFWLGCRGPTARITSVILLEGVGITEEPSFFEISPVVYGRVGTWAGNRGETLLAVVHSHCGTSATWMSSTDRRGAVRVPDVLAVVVPGFGTIVDPLRWGFHRYAGGAFLELTGGQKRDALLWSDDPIAIARADEGGVVDA